MKNYLYLGVLLMSWVLSAQDFEKEYIQSVIPPSPTAFEFSTYGNNPLNGSSGAFQQNIPILNFSVGDIDQTISLNYFSSGVPIDKLAGVVGMDWNLNAGGVISRVVKDFTDENGVRYYPHEINTSVGTIYEQYLYTLARQSSMDGEQDWFSFNVNGISGSFFFDDELNVHVIGDQEVRIIFNEENPPTLPIEPDDAIFLASFTLIDSKGFKYKFGGGLEFRERMNALQECSMTQGEYTSTWYLREIISPLNNHVVFHYSENYLSYYVDQSTPLLLTGTCQNPDIAIDSSINICRNSNVVYSKVLNKIEFDGGHVDFSYNENRLDGGGKSIESIKLFNDTDLVNSVSFQYDTFGHVSYPVLWNDSTLYYRLFLKEILFKGNETTLDVEKYRFEYHSPNTLPNRLSDNKDMYGYNNGSVNNYPYSSAILQTFMGSWATGFANYFVANRNVNPQNVHFGMLSKIYYPTGGRTEIQYEPNKDVVVGNETTQASINIFKYCNTDSAPVTGEFTFISNGTDLNFVANGMYVGQTCTVGPTTNNKYHLKIIKDNNDIILDVWVDYGLPISSNPVTGCQSTFNGSYQSQPVCTVAGSTYKIVLELARTGVSGNCQIKYNTHTVEQPIYAAGARVREIADISSDNVYQRRSFYYNSLLSFQQNGNIFSNHTSMKNYYPANNFTFVPHITGCGVPGQYTDENIMHATFFSSPRTQYLTRQPVHYSYICEFLDSLNPESIGVIEKKYTTTTLDPGQLIVGSDIYGSPASNSEDYRKDKIEEINYYNSIFQKVKSREFQYSTFNQGFVPSMIIRQHYALNGDPNYVGLQMYDVYDPWINYSIYQYKNYYGITKTTQIKESEYFGNQVFFTQTINTYENDYQNLVSIQTISSKGENLKTEYKYAPDLVNIEQTTLMNDLVENHRISDPIITTIHNGSTKLSEKHIKYGQMPLTSNINVPVEVYYKKGAGSINISQTTDRYFKINRYDEKGHILEYSKENGDIVSLIWGYNKNLLVAEIENVSYATITPSIITAIQQAASDASLNSALNSLRVSTAVSQGMVKTYTYFPLVGIRSITDHKGLKTTYEYDSFGRLKFVKDHNGNILSENEYNYRTE